MSQEFERPRFRRGENASRPYGGKISDDPFSQALYNAAVSRGFESQSVLANAVEIRPSTVGKWYGGKSTPTPSVFGDLLVLLNLNDEEREPVVEAYANRIVKRKELQVKNHRSYMKPSNSPLGKWIEDTCKEKNITLGKLSKMLGSNSHLEKRFSLSLGSLEHIRQNAKEALELSEEQTDTLNRLIDREIQQRTEEGHRFQNGMNGSQLKKEQKMLSYRTYNGAQAAVELGVTRPTVSSLREKFGLPHLLTEENLRMLKEHLEKSKDIRQKLQRTRMENRSKEISLSE